MADGGGDSSGDAALRAKYDATTRLLAAQSDAIEGLHAHVRALQEQLHRQQRQQCVPDVKGADGTSIGRLYDGKEEEDDVDEDASDGSAGFETKYRRARRLVKIQVRHRSLRPRPPFPLSRP